MIRQRYTVVSALGLSGTFKVNDIKRGPFQILYSREQADFVARYLNDIEEGRVVPTPLGR